MEFIIITGMSGAGKSKAASCMEDLGFFCVDNLPAALIGKFAELGLAGSGEYQRVVLVTDVRGGTSFEGLFQALEGLRQLNYPCTIVFMDAADETIVRRYKESRRIHPLQADADSLSQAIALEREMLAPLRDRAEYIIDTTDLSSGKLRGELLHLFGPERVRIDEMEIRVDSFGFKHGLPTYADLVFDVRFLPNPYYIANLRPLTGLDEEVRAYVFSFPDTLEFTRRLLDLTEWLLPRYAEEGKTSLVIAVGCTGGRHRSVAVARWLAKRLTEGGHMVRENHRDMGRI